MGFSGQPAVNLSGQRSVGGGRGRHLRLVGCVRSTCVGVGFACAGLAIGACASDGESEPPFSEPRVVKLPSELQGIANLRGTESAFERRPANCKSLHAISIVDRKPRPRKLRTTSGACLFWGNMSSGRMWVRYARVPGRPRQPSPGEFAKPAGAAHAEGPFEIVTPRTLSQIRSDEGGKLGCTKIYPESHYGARYYTPTDGTVRLRYSLDPGGAEGEIVLAGSPGREPQLSPKVREVRRLRCGRNAVDGRPAGCSRPLALVIRDRRPTPRELKVRKREECVVWGNSGARDLRVESERCPGCFFGLSLPAGSAEVTYFGAASPERYPHRFRYTVRPETLSGNAPPLASGTIVLVDR